MVPVLSPLPNAFKGIVIVVRVCSRVSLAYVEYKVSLMSDPECLIANPVGVRRSNPAFANTSIMTVSLCTSAVTAVNLYAKVLGFNS